MPRRPTEAQTPADTGVNGLNEAGFSKLHVAAIRGDAVMARTEIAAGANVNVQQRKFKGAPLQYAAHRGHRDVAKVLLDAGASIESTDSVGRTPLMWAASGSRLEMAKFLVARGAQVDAETKNGWTAIHYARKAGAKDVVEWLLSAGAVDEKTVSKAAVVNVGPLGQADPPNDPMWGPLTEQVRQRLKDRQRKFASELNDLQIPSSEIPDGVRLVTGPDSAIFVPGASQIDDAWFRLIATFFGDAKTLAQHVDAAIVVAYQDDLAGNNRKGNEIGVYALRCQDDETAKRLQRPGLIRKGLLLIYVWKDDVRQEAFNQIRDYYAEKDYTSDGGRRPR